jgi:hypothetical protein
MRILCLLTALLSALAAQAQEGFIRGKVIDGVSGESLYGATLLRQGTSLGTVTDFEGNYSLALPAGSHTIVLSFISYEPQILTDVEVRAGQVTTLNLSMLPVVSELDEVVVSAEALRDDDAGMLTFQRKSLNVIDGLSRQAFGRTGDRDLSGAIRRVTGVSVQDGKFVYVRGLGDRYTRTTLNTMTIPGLDPDRNEVQIDLFPTSVLENVIVYKTFSPDLPGDFTGGIVNVETKKFPEVRTTSLSLGSAYNPDMNFKRSFLSYRGGKTDWLGFDDGTRALPFSEGTQIPDISTGDLGIESLTRSLNPQLAAIPIRSFLNTSVSLYHGNRIDRGSHTIGYNAIFNYRNSFEHNEGVAFGDYTLDDDRSVRSLFAEEIRKGTLSRHRVLWSALLSGALKLDGHTFSASLFRTQSGVAEASNRISRNYDQTQSTLSESILTYAQRSVTSGMMGGEHTLGRLRLNWRNALTVSRSYDPDFRETSIDITRAELPTLNAGAGAGIRRFWRDLNEWNENLKLQFVLPYGRNNIRFGMEGLYKRRDFNIENYRIDVTTRSGVPVDPDYFLRPENIWTAGEQQGSFLRGNDQPTNRYDAASSVLAAYVMTELSLDDLKIVYGARLEKADMFYTGQDMRGRRLNDDHTLNALNLLPAVNVVYAMTDKTNIRGSYGRTLARPSFREKSVAQIYDPITKRFFNGNLDLEQTLIDNLDVRWERFDSHNGLVAISGFAKKFDGHIEMVTYDVATNNVRPRNAGKSRVYGVEFELRKNLSFVGSLLQRISTGVNVTLVRSEVDLRKVVVNESGLTEYASRVNNARTGEEMKVYRPMGGQSPYLVNIYLNYSSGEGDFNANMSYNVQGESLSVIGVGAVPDVYTQPHHSLDLNVYKDFGVARNHRITIGVRNLLDDDKVDLYRGYEGAQAVYSQFKPGRTFSLTYGYSFQR